MNVCLYSGVSVDVVCLSGDLTMFRSGCGLLLLIEAKRWKNAVGLLGAVSGEVCNSSA